jgi:uncharacterized protein
VSEQQVIEAAKNGDREALEKALSAGADVNEQDEQGWTALNWAAGAGDAETVRFLLDRGADATLTGRDNRTPLMIAKAADRKEVAEILTAKEQELGVWEDPRKTQPYCKAYYLKDLRGFDEWSSVAAEPAGENGDGAQGDDIVYIHQDFTVTESMWHGEDVIVGEVTPAWQAYCEGPLEFAIPDDLL